MYNFIDILAWQATIETGISSQLACDPTGFMIDYDCDTEYNCRMVHPHDKMN